MKSRVAIIAALAGEVKPLVRGWMREPSDAGVVVYSSQGAIAAFAGMGAERARLALAAVRRLGPIHQIVSAGWAGGLNGGMVGGQAYWVRRVIDAGSGEIFETSLRRRSGPPVSVLATVPRVASPEDKLHLRETCLADLVDMEAAAVAAAAREAGLPFLAIKAVSDGHDLDLPEMGRFTTEDGGFRQSAFAAHVALRPRLWGPVLHLARDSGAAARNLCRELERHLVQDCMEGQNLPDSP